MLAINVSVLSLANVRPDVVQFRPRQLHFCGQALAPWPLSAILWNC